MFSFFLLFFVLLDLKNRKSQNKNEKWLYYSVTLFVHYDWESIYGQLETKQWKQLEKDLSKTAQYYTQ